MATVHADLISDGDLVETREEARLTRVYLVELSGP
jgi:hypothetical protein